MIFLTVGTQEPFDRLVRAVDAWAGMHDGMHGGKLFGQLGRMKPDSYRPQNFPWEEFISADEYQERLEDCSVLVAHAGMGSIISALTWGKPLVMMARRASLGEHRNEHQSATAEKFASRAGLDVAADADEVGPLIDRLLTEGRTGQMAGLGEEASPELISTLRDFVAAPPRKG